MSKPHSHQSHAVSEAKQTLVYDYLDHCLDPVAGPDRVSSAEDLKEFKKIARYL